MELRHDLPDRDPWSSSCHEEFDNPDWGPLAKVIGDQQVSEFMWMGRIRATGWSVELYKHRYSRRYLNVDLEGNAYRYVDSRYQPISTAEALRRVFGRTQT